jgi:hypothetical protein
MATKPVVRIPNWASGGTKTDPGAGKEAAGWEVNERPPASWFNWIYNAFGQWISWAEDSIDDLEVRRVQAFGRVASNGSGGASVVYNGSGLAAPSILGSALRVNTSITFSSTASMMAVATCESDSACNLAAEIIDTNTVEINGTLTSTGGVWNFSSTATEINIIILGDLA